MRLADDGTIGLSPSDLSAHLACPHLTTLSVRVVRGRARAAAPGLAASRPDLPEGGRARGGVPRAARGRGPLDRPHPDLRRRGVRPGRGAAADRGGDPGRRRGRHLPAVPQRRELARVRGLPRTAARRAVRAGRHEARAVGEAGARAAALLLRRAGRADPGRARRAHPRRDRARRARDVPRRRVRGVLPARARAVPRRARAPGRHVSVALRPLRDLRLPPALPRAARRRRPPRCSSPGCGAGGPSS